MDSENIRLVQEVQSHLLPESDVRIDLVDKVHK